MSSPTNILSHPNKSAGSITIDIVTPLKAAEGAWCLTCVVHAAGRCLEATWTSMCAWAPR